jgi:hypothetical protein
MWRLVRENAVAGRGREPCSALSESLALFSSTAGPETAEKACYAPRTPIQNRPIKSIHCEKRQGQLERPGRARTVLAVIGVDAREEFVGEA